jgi:hypothetical protein
MKPLKHPPVILAVIPAVILKQCHRLSLFKEVSGRLSVIRNLLHSKRDNRHLRNIAEKGLNTHFSNDNRQDNRGPLRRSPDHPLLLPPLSLLVCIPRMGAVGREVRLPLVRITTKITGVGP